jgi:hypothetical protein
VDPRIDIGEVATPSTPVSPLAASPKAQGPSFCAPSAKLRGLLQAAYQKEPPDPKEIDDLEFRSGLWWIWDWVFVPIGLRSRVLQALHDKSTSGNPGSLKTLDVLTRSMYWPGI